MTLTQAKHLADQIANGHPVVRTTAERLEAIRLLEATNHGSKTQKAWDRLARRLKALREQAAA